MEEHYTKYCQVCKKETTFTYDPTGVLIENCINEYIYICEKCGIDDRFDAPLEKIVRGDQ